MISRIMIRRSSQALAPVIFLLFCATISAFAETQTKPPQLIKVTFRDSTIKEAVSLVAKQISIRIVYDDSIKDDNTLSMEIKDVSPLQALKIIFDEKKLQARFMEERTLIVFLDNEANRKKYDQYDIWSPDAKPVPTRLRYAKPITFMNILSKAAIAVVARDMGLRVEFDVTVKDDRLSIDLPDVTHENALKIILEKKNLKARFMEEKTLIIFPDNEETRKKYEDFDPWPSKEKK